MSPKPNVLSSTIVLIHQSKTIVPLIAFARVQQNKYCQYNPSRGRWQFFLYHSCYNHANLPFANAKLIKVLFFYVINLTFIWAALSLSQFCLSTTRKNDITRCVTTCYVVISCGGRTRTCDLQVMSLASYQLLHSAILKLSISQLRVQRYTVFCERANFRWKKLVFGVNIFLFITNCS